MKKIVFIDKTSGKKITVRPLFDPHKIFSPLFQKVRKEPGFAPQVQKALNEAVQQYIYGPAEKLFKLEQDEKNT